MRKGKITSKDAEYEQSIRSITQPRATNSVHNTSRVVIHIYTNGLSLMFHAEESKSPGLAAAKTKEEI